MLEAIFERARNDRRSAFIPYLMAGDPDLPSTERMLHALAGLRVDAVELGIPYGDPLADGPAIAAAAQRALNAGTRMADVFPLVSRFRDAGGPPVILFTYFNPVYQYGLERFANDAAAAGACAAIVPDIALEEGEALARALERTGLDMPLLVAPSTTRDRAAQIVQRSTGFVYVVSRLGVTGAGDGPDSQQLRAQIAMLRGLTHRPLAVGFGISEPRHVAALSGLADGIIVGSALIEAYAGSTGSEAAARVRRFAEPLVAATHFACSTP